MDDSEHKTIIKWHTTLAEIFGKAGYYTAAFHSNPLLTRLRNYNKGFDKFDEGWGDTPGFSRLRIWLAEGASKIVSNKLMTTFVAKLSNYIDSLLFASRVKSPTLSAEQISAKAVSWLNSHNKNFFLWLHYMDVHVPYMPPQKYIKQFHKKPLSRFKISSLWRKSRWNPARLSPTEIETIMKLYDACIKYVDDSIGWLLNTAGNRLENTIIIVTADHGDEFREHGKTSHLTLYDGVLHVPLIMTGPGIESGSSVREQAELMDLAPTLVDLVGLDKPATFNGQTLLPLMRGEKASDRGIISVYIPMGIVGPLDTLLYIISSYRTPKWKYIRTESATPPRKLIAEEIYNLQDDPGEKVNLNGTETEAIFRFKLEAIGAIEQFKKEKEEKLTSFEKERIKDQIKKLRT